MNPYNLSLLLFAYCSLFVGLLVLIKRNDEIGKTYFVFSLFIAVWGVGNSWMYSNDFGPAVSLQGTRLAHFGAFFLTSSFLNFVYAYIGIVEKRRNLIRATYVAGGILSLFTFSNWFIPNVKSIVGFNYFTGFGPVYIFYTIYYFSLISYGFFELLRYWLSCDGDKKRRVGVFVAAVSVGFSSGTLAFAPVFDIPIPQYNLFVLPIYPFLMAYAIMKRGFLDSDEVLAIHRDKLALIGLISSSINHELKNPLFILQELAKKTAGELVNDPRRSNENLNQSVSKMSDQIVRMRTLVERLGEFGRPNVGSQNDEVDIKEAIENALYFASQELRYHNIKVSTEFPENLPKLEGVKSQFEEIFLNLIINAYHAMPNGGELKIEARNNNGIEITISDTGTGIQKDELQNIFKPFYTTKQKTGTGLGLHIVKTLVEQNGGKITVESEVGKGTRFRIIFL